MSSDRQWAEKQIEDAKTAPISYMRPAAAV